MINEDSVDDSSGSGGDALDSSGSISISTESELLVNHLTITLTIKNSGTKHDLLTTTPSQSQTQTTTSTTTMVTKTSFLKTKDFKEIKTDNRTDPSEPEIIVDPNIIPKKKNQDGKSPSFDSRTADCSLPTNISFYNFLFLLIILINQ